MLAVALSGVAKADARDERAPVPQRRPERVDLLNPLTLLSEAIATLIRREARHVTLSDGARYSVQQGARASALVPQSEMTVRFAQDNEHDKVSLLLAESQIRIRLAQDLQLRCELSSSDEPNLDPEIKLGVGVHFRFE
jgi:hypothetical protein